MTIKKPTSKKLNYVLIGLILILVIIITFGLSTSKAFQTEIDGLNSEISERDDLIESLTRDNEIHSLIDEIQEETNSILRRKLDSILDISYDIPNPKSDPVPEHNARNDSIRKWSKRFQ